VAQEVEHLPSKHEALSSNSTAKIIITSNALFAVTTVAYECEMLITEELFVYGVSLYYVCNSPVCLKLL
jgi:hypothetical protein